MKLNELIKKRATAFDAFKALADKDALTPEEETDYAAKKRAVEDLDNQIKRAKEAQALALETAQPVEGQETVVRAEAGDDDPYSSEAAAKRAGLKTHLGLRAVACAKIFFAAGMNPEVARGIATENYGERHPITRAFEGRRERGARSLVTSVGASGGFIVPPDYVNEIIELLRPRAVVRSANPRTMPMPRGTMQLPSQKTAATASYGAEGKKIATSQQSLGKIVASYKKLTALVPVSNDMMRYADPAADAFVRDDLVKVTALREDKAFLLDDGTQDTPRGFLSFANGWVTLNGGTAGVWNTGANSTLAVNGADPSNSTGGNFISSNATYTLATVASELGGAVNRLDQANVAEDRRVWFMNPRSYNYLFNVQNSLGVYVYREELLAGKLLGYPYKKTTQIPTNYWDATGTNKDLSFVFLVEMDEAILLDSMTLELAVSREGTYIDGTGATVSAFQNDETLIRAIAEHDFQMRHDQSVAVIQGVRWAPAIS
ncbi:MAG TPA: phage major capsid protein [Burkholderiales bacterium]|nr:phage major capsid protein [Burkholderiales bacterium]